MIAKVVCVLLMIGVLWIAAQDVVPLRRKVPVVAAGGGSSPGVESSGSTNTTDQTSSNMIFSVTIAGSNRMLLIGGGIGDTDLNGNSIIGITNTTTGTGFSQSWVTNSPDFVRSSGWYQVNPNSGANTIVMHYGASIADQRCVIWANVTNVHQTVPVDTAATASGTSTSASVVVTSAANDLVLSFFATDAGNIDGDDTVIASGTQVQLVVDVGNDTNFGMAQGAGAATVTHTWTIGNEDWAIGGVSINPP